MKKDLIEAGRKICYTLVYPDDDKIKEFVGLLTEHILEEAEKRSIPHVTFDKQKDMTKQG